MASTTHEEAKVSVVTRSGAGEQHEQPSEVDLVQDEDVEIKEGTSREATTDTDSRNKSQHGIRRLHSTYH